MIKRNLMIEIDNFFTFKPGYLIKNENEITGGTSYCNFHFKKALLDEKNDFTGNNLVQIQKIMKAKSGRENLNHINILKGRLKKSGIPIEVKVTTKIPFEVIYHVDNPFEQKHDTITKLRKKKYAPNKQDILSARDYIGGVNTNIDKILDIIEMRCKEKNVELINDWRNITESKLPIWFQNIEDIQ